MASDELDALLTAGVVGPDGTTTALTAKDISRILGQARGTGFGKGRGAPASPPGGDAEPPPTPRVEGLKTTSGDELGAAFDALEAGGAPAPPRPEPPRPEPPRPEPPPLNKATDRDALPTSVMAKAERPRAPAADVPDDEWGDGGAEEAPTNALPSRQPPAAGQTPVPGAEAGAPGATPGNASSSSGGAAWAAGQAAPFATPPQPPSAPASAPASAQVTPSVPASAPASARVTPGVPTSAPTTARVPPSVPASAPASAPALTPPSARVTPSAPAAAPASVPAPPPPPVQASVPASAPAPPPVQASAPASFPAPASPQVVPTSVPPPPSAMGARVHAGPSGAPPAVVDTPLVVPKSRTGLIAALVMSIITIVVVTIFLLLRSSNGEEPSRAPGVGKAAPGAATQAGNVAAASPAEAAARAALWRMAEGVRACSRNVLGDLPGTAPAIPSTFGQLKGGLYASAPNDYHSPVYSCTNFRQTEPQAFQIQWQIFKDKGEGMAIAWLDTNSDGKPDRALGLRAKLVKSGEVSLGEIEPLEPLPAVTSLR